jgi:hypothetical protein
MACKPSAVFSTSNVAVAMESSESRWPSFSLKTTSMSSVGNWRQVKRRVAVQHLVIEPQIVEAHHQIGALQFGDEIVDLRSRRKSVFAAPC